MKPSERIRELYESYLNVEAKRFVSRWRAELVIREFCMNKAIVEFLDEQATEAERAERAEHFERMGDDL